MGSWDKKLYILEHLAKHIGSPNQPDQPLLTVTKIPIIRIFCGIALKGGWWETTLAYIDFLMHIKKIAKMHCSPSPLYYDKCSHLYNKRLS